MHVVHHTHAVILKSQPAGEANRRVWLFTRDFGLVIAMVQGVRKQGAKLQMQLVEYSFVTADLVRGKEVWRLVSVTARKMPLLSVFTDDLARSYVRTLAAVERFCHGEEANHELFDHLCACADALVESEYDALLFDTVSLWKVMVLLGYSAIDDRDQLIFNTPFKEAIMKIDQKTKDRLIRETNMVIQQTHL